MTIYRVETSGSVFAVEVQDGFVVAGPNTAECALGMVGMSEQLLLDPKVSGGTVTEL